MQLEPLGFKLCTLTLAPPFKTSKASLNLCFKMHRCRGHPYLGLEMFRSTRLFVSRYSTMSKEFPLKAKQMGVVSSESF